MRRWGLALAAAFLACALTAPAVARTPLSDHGQGAQLRTDSRYAVWTLADGKTRRVLDTGTLATIDVPAPDTCIPFGFVARQLTFYCDTNGHDPSGWRARYVNVVTGAAHDVLLRAGEISDPGLIATGAKWVQTGISDHRGGFHHDYIPVYGGESFVDPGQSETSILDVDFAPLHRDLCKPLKRKLLEEGFDEEPSTYEPFVYHPPYALHTKYGKGRDALRVDRCGTSHSTWLLSVGTGSYPLVGWLARKTVSWFGLDAIEVRRLGSRRTYSWPLENPKPQNIGHTKYRVVAQNDGRILSARLPSG
jgi:hypothetical protein